MNKMALIQEVLEGSSGTITGASNVQIGGRVQWQGGAGWLYANIGNVTGAGSFTVTWFLALSAYGNVIACNVPELTNIKPNAAGFIAYPFFAPPGILSVSLNAPIANTDSISLSQVAFAS